MQNRLPRDTRPAWLCVSPGHDRGRSLPSAKRVDDTSSDAVRELVRSLVRDELLPDLGGDPDAGPLERGLELLDRGDGLRQVGSVAHVPEGLELLLLRRIRVDAVDLSEVGLEGAIPSDKARDAVAGGELPSTHHNPWEWRETITKTPFCQWPIANISEKVLGSSVPEPRN